MRTCSVARIAYYLPDDKDIVNKAYWSEVMIWLQTCCQRSRESFTQATKPFVTEILLFEEFRYRFEPGWRPQYGWEAMLAEYINFAQYWARSSYWPERPWSIKNFPQQPQSFSIFPKFTTLQERLNDPSIVQYRFHSAKLRTLLKAFPDILRCPRVWRKCMTADTLDISISQAIRAKKIWKKPPLENFEFEISKRCVPLASAAAAKHFGHRRIDLHIGEGHWASSAAAVMIWPGWQ